MVLFMIDNFFSCGIGGSDASILYEHGVNGVEFSHIYDIYTLGIMPCIEQSRSSVVGYLA